jgi:hypothetical protein
VESQQLELALEEYTISFNAIGTQLVEEIERTFHKFGYSIRRVQDVQNRIHIYYDKEIKTVPKLLESRC